MKISKQVREAYSGERYVHYPHSRGQILADALRDTLGYLLYSLHGGGLTWDELPPKDRAFWQAEADRQLRGGK